MLRLICLAVAGLFAASAVPTSAPVPPAEVAPMGLITLGLEEELERVEKLLAEADKYDDNEEQLMRAGGVIACLSQAAIEHADHEQAKYAAPALRDAGLELQSVGDHEEAVAVQETLKQAWEGKSEGEHEREHAWDELIGMYEMMEEMNDRNGGLSRSLRRSRGRESEQLNASTNAVLALAMMADHNYLIEEEDAKTWDQLSLDYQKAMTGLIGAIKEKDQDKIAEFYKAGNRACDTCHEQFRD